MSDGVRNGGLALMSGLYAMLLSEALIKRLKDRAVFSDVELAALVTQCRELAEGLRGEPGMPESVVDMLGLRFNALQAELIGLRATLVVGPRPSTPIPG